MLEKLLKRVSGIENEAKKKIDDAKKKTAHTIRQAKRNAATLLEEEKHKATEEGKEILKIEKDKAKIEASKIEKEAKETTDLKLKGARKKFSKAKETLMGKIKGSLCL